MSCETHGKCNDICWSASGHKCECVCGGVNHGLIYKPYQELDMNFPVEDGEEDAE